MNFLKIIEKVNISVDGFPVADAVFGQAKNGLSPLWSRNETTTFHDRAFGKRKDCKEAFPLATTPTYKKGSVIVHGCFVSAIH